MTGLSVDDREQVDADLGVASWPVLAGTRPASVPAPAAAEPTDPDVPAWWTGENTDEFLASVGITLDGIGGGPQ